MPDKTISNQAISMEVASLPAQSYLDQARNTDSKLNKDKLTLLASKALLKNNQTEAAEILLTNLANKLNPAPAVQAQYRYLRTKVMIKRHQYNDALAQLNFASQWQLPAWQWQDYYQTRAWLYSQMQQPLFQVAELSLLAKFLNEQEATQINDNIWHLLRSIPQDKLAEQAQNATEPLYSGWLKLAYIAKHYGALSLIHI